MSLRKEVLHRLLLAKSVLAPDTSTVAAWPNPHLVAKRLLNAHDAADLVFASIADHQRRLPAKGKAPSMLDCLDLIDSNTGKHTGYFKQLNDARNSLKHVGNLGRGSHLGGFVNVGQHQNPCVAPHAAEYSKRFFDSKPAMGVDGSAIRFIVRRLEDVGYADALGDRADRISHLQSMRFTFDEARPGNEEQGSAANFDVSDFERLDRDRHK